MNDDHRHTDARSFALLTSSVRRYIRNGVAAAGLAIALSSPSSASADATAFGDGGVFLGYTWGAGGGFTWGLEGRVGAHFHDTCRGGPSFGTAATGRFAFVEFTRPRLAVGAQAGIVFGPTSLLGDVGVGHRWGEDGGLSVPLALDLQVSAWNAFIGVDTALDNGFAGAGIRLPMPDRQFGCSIAGRALHDEDGHAELPAVHAAAPLDLPSDVERAVVSEWAQRAQTEWASVPAFLQLADQLERASAPPALIARALRAAEDELRHAILSARVAIRHGAAPLALGRVTPATRAPAEGIGGLQRLAVESWIDGCLGEGKAAAAAACEADHAADGVLRDLQQSIAVDEASHAELAWDVLAWATRAGGDDVRHAVEAVREAGPTEASGSAADLDLAAFGLLSEGAHRRIGEVTRARAVGRLDRLLAV